MEMILWIIGAGEICLLAALIVIAANLKILHNRSCSWTSNLATNVGKQQENLQNLDDELTKLYDEFQTSREKIEALDQAVKSLMEEDEEAAGEKVRQKVLLQELNDELEKSLNQQKEYNEGVAGIIAYGIEDAIGKANGGK